MGRREAPVTTPNQALAALALWLRTARANAGLTYRQLAAGVGLHATTLQRAASGARTPSREVVRAYAKGCGAREDHAEQLWKEARYEARRAVRDRQTSLAAPRPELVRDFADLGAVLVELYDKAGAPPLREMEQRAGRFGLLPRSTAHRIVNKQTIPHGHAQFEAFLRACDVEGLDQRPWLDAWNRAWQEHSGTARRPVSLPARARMIRTQAAEYSISVPSTGMLRSLVAAGYELLSWHTDTPAMWRARCINCHRPVDIEVDQTTLVRDCHCRRTSHVAETTSGGLQALSDLVNPQSEDQHALEEALQRLELSRSRLRAPLLDPAEEARATGELRSALRSVYVAMTEHGRLEAPLRNRAQELLNRSTDLLAWIEAEPDAESGESA